MNTDSPFHQGTEDFALIDPIGEVGKVRGDTPQSVAGRQDCILQWHAFFLDPRGVGSQHQPWEIYFPTMGRNIRAMWVAQLALITQIDDSTNCLAGQLYCLTIDLVDTIQEYVKRGAEVVTT